MNFILSRFSAFAKSGGDAYLFESFKELPASEKLFAVIVSFQRLPKQLLHGFYDISDGDSFLMPSRLTS